MKFRQACDLKPGTTLLSRSNGTAYVLLRHADNGVVWLDLLTAKELPMSGGQIDEGTWKIVEGP